MENTLAILAPGVCDEDAFPNICRLLVIAYTLPITNAEAEPSVSLMMDEMNQDLL